MRGTLVPPDLKALGDEGSYFIDHYALMQMNLEEQTALEAAIKQALEDNPEFEMSFSQQYFPRLGVMVKWRRMTQKEINDGHREGYGAYYEQ